MANSSDSTQTSVEGHPPKVPHKRRRPEKKPKECKKKPRTKRQHNLAHLCWQAQQVCTDLSRAQTALLEIVRKLMSLEDTLE